MNDANQDTTRLVGALDAIGYELVGFEPEKVGTDQDGYRFTGIYVLRIAHQENEIFQRLFAEGVKRP